MSNHQWYVSLFWTYVFVLSNPISHFSCKKFKDWFLWKITICVAASIFCINGIALLACFPFLFPFWSAGRTFFSLDYHEMRFGDEGSKRFLPFMWHTFRFVWPRFSKNQNPSSTSSAAELLLREVKTWTQTDAQREKCSKSSSLSSQQTSQGLCMTQKKIFKTVKITLHSYQMLIQCM